MLRILPSLLVALAAGLLASEVTSGCFCAACGECPPDDKSVAAGASVNGVDPEASVAPMFRTYDGPLTWVPLARSTTAHLTITRDTGVTVARWDTCGSSEVLEAFVVPSVLHMVTDDGALDFTLHTSVVLSADGSLPPAIDESFPIATFADRSVLPVPDAGSSLVRIVLTRSVDAGGDLWLGNLSDAGGIIATLQLGP